MPTPRSNTLARIPMIQKALMLFQRPRRQYVIAPGEVTAPAQKYALPIFYHFVLKYLVPVPVRPTAAIGSGLNRHRPALDGVALPVEFLHRNRAFGVVLGTGLHGFKRRRIQIRAYLAEVRSLRVVRFALGAPLLIVAGFEPSFERCAAKRNVGRLRVNDGSKQKNKYGGSGFIHSSRDPVHRCAILAPPPRTETNAR